MAKDRFSKFKRSNWDVKAKGMYTSLNHPVILGRKKLTRPQRLWFINIIPTLGTEQEKMYLRSVLIDGKIPTSKQVKVIREILIKNERKK